MRITADDMRAIIFLIKRLMTGILIGGRYIIAGQVAVEANAAATKTLTTNTGSVKSSVSKRRIKQRPPIVIDENVYEVPAMVRLKKINLEKWQAEKLKA